MALEDRFDAAFATRLALREKQIQQSYRPIIGIHKWFARRPGSVFRCLLLAEFGDQEGIGTSYWRNHRLQGVIADPFMGGGTPIYEATRLGFHTIGADVNPMAYWIVRQALMPLNVETFREVASNILSELQTEIGDLYRTECQFCGALADVKYFLWVKTATCPDCEAQNDLFPGYLLAADERHPRNVLVCNSCGHLNEYEDIPTRARTKNCGGCDGAVYVEGPAGRQKVSCRECGAQFAYGIKGATAHPDHRMWAIEYHCRVCRPRHVGRFFKAPDERDLARVLSASCRLAAEASLPIPDSKIPAGDETARLHRWGYRRYREMFNDRQLLGLGTLLARLMKVPEAVYRHALLTVFSDCLRYQNMLCRYDTVALKCQDIFSVHGFPVGLVQCENNLLGIPSVGSGAFRHFVEKYVRAKEYCRNPFEVVGQKSAKRIVRIAGETIQANLVENFPKGVGRQTSLHASPAARVNLPPRSLDGVFTDPPYFDNVQYAELMDFCFVWLRLALHREFKVFKGRTTRTDSELTGNVTRGRGLSHFTEGLSTVFRRYAAALKPGAPFVFTYHHNQPEAYVPVVVAILDARLQCTATLPAAAEMGASLHIAGTESSVLDSVFVCRRRTRRSATENRADVVQARLALARDVEDMRAAGCRITAGDIKCLGAGHVARLAVNALARTWKPNASLGARMARASKILKRIAAQLGIDELSSGIHSRTESVSTQPAEVWLPGFAAEA